MPTFPGVTGLAPVERESVSLPGVPRAQALALDASVASGLVHLRPDLSVAPVAELMAPLAAAQPSLEAVRLPGEPRALRLAVDLKIGAVERSEYDEKTKAFVFVPAEASEIAGWRGLDLSVVVRDARGLLHRFEGQRTTVDGGPHEVVVPLGPEADAADATFAYPLDLLAIELLIRIPERYQVPNARVTVGDLASARRCRCRVLAAGPACAWRTGGAAPSPTSAGPLTVSSRTSAVRRSSRRSVSRGSRRCWERTGSAAGPSCGSRPSPIAELAGADDPDRGQRRAPQGDGEQGRRRDRPDDRRRPARGPDHLQRQRLPGDRARRSRRRHGSGHAVRSCGSRTAGPSSHPTNGGCPSRTGRSTGSPKP